MSESDITAKAGLLGLVGCYVAVLLWAVSTLVAPLFEYQGYVVRSVSVMEVLVVSLGTVVIALTMPTRCHLPSQVAQIFLMLTVAIPVLWVPLLYGPLSTVQVQNLALCTTACFGAIWLSLRGYRRRLVPLKLSRTTFWLLVSGFCALAVGYLLSLGLAPRVVGFSDVYAQRANFKANIDTVGAYLVGWLAGGTLTVILAVGLYHRRLWLVVAAVTGVVYLYSLTGQKSFIIGLAVVIGTFWMTRSGVTKTWHWLSLLTSVIVIAGVVDRLRGGFEITSLLVRRAISTAGMNTAYYVDLFDGAPLYELRHSVLAFLGPAPYDAPPSRLVGETYYSTATSANANFMADGFANFGWGGILVAGIVVGILLRLYDRLSIGLSLGITAPALVFVLLALANTAVLTVVASHGAAVLLGWVGLLAGSIRVAAHRVGCDGEATIHSDTASSRARPRSVPAARS